MFIDNQRVCVITTFMCLPLKLDITVTQTHTNPLRGGYKKYAEQFKNKPGSYLTSFAILHELTAVAPFPVIYYVLDSSSLKIPFDEEYLQEGNKFINKARVYYGYEPLDPDNQTMLHLVSTYCIVKVLLPVRLAASAAMTPFFAEKFISPSIQWIRRIKK